MLSSRDRGAMSAPGTPMATAITPLWAYPIDTPADADRSNMPSPSTGHTQHHVEDIGERVEDVIKRMREEENQYEKMRSVIAESLDESFASDIEKDESFRRGAGIEFENKYLKHRFAKVREWSMSSQRLMNLREELTRLVESRRVVTEDREYINKTAADLIRSTQQARDELRQQSQRMSEAITAIQEEQRQLRVDVQTQLDQWRLGPKRADTTSTHMLQEERRIREEMQKEIEQMRFQIQNLAELIITIQEERQVREEPRRQVQAPVPQAKPEEQVEIPAGPCLTCTIHDPGLRVARHVVEHVAGSNGYQKAMGGEPLPRNEPTCFTICIDTLGTPPWLLCGIISNTACVSSTADPSSFGWSGAGKVVVGGQNISHHDGWPTSRPWQQGDVAVFRYNPEERQMCMFHARLNRKFTINDLPDLPFRFHLSLYSNGSKAGVFSASPSDIARAGFARS